MASPVFISQPPPGFSPSAILKGIQLALIGAYQTAQPLKYTHFYQIFKISLFIQLVLWCPILAFGILLKLVNLFIKVNTSAVINHLSFVQNNILNISPLIISSIKYYTPEIDNLFFASLQYVDSWDTSTPGGGRYNALSQLPVTSSSNSNHTHTIFKLNSHLSRYFNTVMYNIFCLVVSKIPYMGSLTLAAVSFRNFDDILGTSTSLFLFILILIIPHSYSIIIVSTFWGSKNLAIDLIQPYLARIPFTASEQKQWFRAREGVLFGFGLVFYLSLQMPCVGVMIYGVGVCSAGYLITRITDPPPGPVQGRTRRNTNGQLINWCSSQIVWSAESLAVGLRFPEFLSKSQS